MKYIRSELFNDYTRECRERDILAGTRAGCVICEDDILRAHYIIADYFIEEGEAVVYGVKNYDLLSSATHRQVTNFGGIEKWETDFQKMATLLYGLVKNHAFHDGNKRTALLVLLLYMERCKLQLRVEQKKLETLLIRIAANRLDEYTSFAKYINNDEPIINFIADLIKKYTRSQNKRYYTITFAEFNHKLNRFNVRLCNPSGNYIDVHKIIEEKKMGLFTKQKDIRIKQIGFPGWKKQVNIKALKEVLKAAQLTAEYGVDSDVFFNGEEPIYALIHEYRGPLARLKDE